jgi:hypothetical protein
MKIKKEKSLKKKIVLVCFRHLGVVTPGGGLADVIGGPDRETDPGAGGPQVAARSR